MYYHLVSIILLIIVALLQEAIASEFFRCFSSPSPFHADFDFQMSAQILLLSGRRFQIALSRVIICVGFFWLRFHVFLQPRARTASCSLSTHPPVRA